MNLWYLVTFLSVAYLHGLFKCLGVIIWGLQCLIIWIISLLLLLCLSVVYVKWVCRFQPNKTKHVHNLDALRIEEANKSSSKWPNTDIPWWIPLSRTMQHDATKEERGSIHISSHYGLIMVVHGASSSPGSLVFFATFWMLRVFLPLYALISSIKARFLAAIGSIIHLISLHSSQELH